MYKDTEEYILQLKKEVEFKYIEFTNKADELVRLCKQNNVFCAVEVTDSYDYVYVVQPSCGSNRDGRLKLDVHKTMHFK
jgi:hypothetical protein